MLTGFYCSYLDYELAYRFHVNHWAHAVNEVEVFQPGKRIMDSGEVPVLIWRLSRTGHAFALKFCARRERKMQQPSALRTNSCTCLWKMKLLPISLLLLVISRRGNGLTDLGLPVSFACSEIGLSHRSNNRHCLEIASDFAK